MLTIDGNYIYILIFMLTLVALATSFLTIFSLRTVTVPMGETSTKSNLSLFFIVTTLLFISIWSISFMSNLLFALPVQVVFNRYTIIMMIVSFVMIFVILRMAVADILSKRMSWLINVSLSLAILMINIIVPSIVTGSAGIREGQQLSSYLVAFGIIVLLGYFFIKRLQQLIQQLTQPLFWKPVLLLTVIQLVFPFVFLAERSIYFNFSNYAITVVQHYQLIAIVQFILTIFVVTILINVLLIMLVEKHRLKKMAHSDPLTGLPNRHALNHYIKRKYQQDAYFALLFLDLDQFKWINDTLGHDVGDLLIQEVGQRIRLTITKDSEIFRFGGDEFLIVADAYEQEHAERLAERLLEMIRLPFRLNNNELYVTGSIGISYSPVHGITMPALLKTADTALYYAKDLGKNQYYSYDEALNEKLMRKMEIEKGLCAAYLYQQVELHYQPKWNAAANRPIGFEALLRWTHHRLGAISPLEFIPIAEKTGMIVPLTKWVLEQACLDCVDWNKKANANYFVSVNISYKVLESRNLYVMVEEVLKKCNLPPHLLELEITELALLHDGPTTIQQLKQLQALGIKITMDNFGAGYSFFSALDRVPFHTLKIDREYIGNLHSPSKQAIVTSLVTLSQRLNLQIIAEGVENEQQLQFLQAAGCHIMQGYYFQPPVSRKDLYIWLDAMS